MPKTKRKPSVYDKLLSKDFVVDLLCNPRQLHVTCWTLLVVEVILNVYVIQTVRYTEIDWIAYMQEVEGFLNGTTDYGFLKGDTGPLVYPAGFVYVYAALYWVTSRGTNVRLAQYVFVGLYVVQLYFVFRLHRKSAKVPPYALIVTTLTSYRIHSIFVLRLFNDPVAVLLFYASLNLYLDDKWIMGSVFYSLAVGVKMNVLLYAPCLLAFYLTNLGARRAILNILVCATVQLVIGAPFLATNWIAYLKGSFDLGRVFEHKWTVNYRFLDRDVFEHRLFHASLLLLHVVLLFAFLPATLKYLRSYAKLNRIKADLGKERKAASIDFDRTTQLLVLPFFVTNLIGVACARSLHYQFYCWYFHSLVHLVYCTGFGRPLMFCLLGVIELCWNTYPSTVVSSVTLHVCHAILLIGLYRYTNQ